MAPQKRHLGYCYLEDDECESERQPGDTLCVRKALSASLCLALPCPTPPSCLLCPPTALTPCMEPLTGMGVLRHEDTLAGFSWAFTIFQDNGGRAACGDLPEL